MTRVVWLAAPALLAACSLGKGPGPTTPTSPALPYAGADISALTRIEQAGGVFRSNGTAGDAVQILHAQGMNTFRLRIFVNPPDTDVVVNDLPYTLHMAARIKAAGAKFILDFHYSDTWADPGHQATPAAWAPLGIDSLEAQVERYTAGVIAALKAQGTLPDIVQIGNEIDGGFLWPLGQITGTGDTLTQWTQFTDLLKAGIQGVHDSLGPADTVRIMLHYSQGGSTGGTQWFFDHMGAYGVPYDLMGLSYYPWWHGALGSLQANLDAAALRYGKSIIVVETSYPWRAGGWESMVVDTFAMAWPATTLGQAQYVAQVATVLAGVPGKRGQGLLWWYPEAIPVTGLYVYGGGSLALFDSTGNVLPAATELHGP